MSKQVECDLKQAVYFAKENGGFFWIKKAKNPVKFHRSNDGYIRDEIGDKMGLWEDALFEDWVYEPPEKSVFQEWNEKEPGHIWKEFGSKDSFMVGRKEGFNFALSEVIKILEATESMTAISETIKKVEAMKEP